MQQPSSSSKASVPIAESLRAGWNIMKQHIGFFILLLLVYYVIYFALAFVVEMTADYNAGLYFILNILLYVVNILLSLGLIGITLAFLDNKKPAIADLFSQTPVLGNAILLYILYSLIVIGGLILLIVPGIIWAIKYSLSFYLLVDKKLSVMDSLKQSGEITKGAKLELFLFGIVTGLVNLAGLLALGIGLFVTVPTTMLAYSYVYRKLLKDKGNLAPAAPMDAMPTTNA